MIVITRFWNYDTLNLEAYLTLSAKQKYQTKVSKVSNESNKCQTNTISSIKQAFKGKNNKSIRRGITINLTEDHRGTQMISIDRQSEHSFGKFTASVKVQCLSYLLLN